MADAVATAQAAALEEQPRRYKMINDVSDEADKNMQRLLAHERAAAEKRVREQAAAFARRSRSDACATSPASSGTAVGDSASVLAELPGELDEMAGIYAAEADRGRIAGVAYERTYDALEQAGTSVLRRQLC